jgi:hypothetical protein
MTLDKVVTIVSENGDFRKDIKEKIEAAKMQMLQTLQKSLSGDSSEPAGSVDNTGGGSQLVAAMQRVPEEDTGQSHQESLNGVSSPSSIVGGGGGFVAEVRWLADTEPKPADTNHQHPMHADTNHQHPKPADTTLRPHPPTHRSPPPLRAPRRFVPATAEGLEAQDRIQRALNLHTYATAGRRRKKQVLPSVGQKFRAAAGSGEFVLL